MKFFSWNVNGIRTVLKKDTILPFIEEYQPDILCVQESKAKQELVAIELPGLELSGVKRLLGEGDL